MARKAGIGSFIHLDLNADSDRPLFHQLYLQLRQAILEGREGPHRDIVVVNAAAGLVASGVAQDLRDGVHRAESALSSGEALRRLEKLRAMFPPV